MKTVLKMLAICMMAGGLGVQSVYAEPLVIQEQGSFSAGGTIITAPGTFDAKKPLDSAGQTFSGRSSYCVVFSDGDSEPRRCLLCSLLYQAFNVTEALAFAVLKRSLAYRRAVKKVIMPAQGPQQNVDSLFRVAKCINQQRKSRRMLLTAGIVKVISGKSWTPLL